MFSLVMDYLVGTLQGIALVDIITVLTVVIFLITNNMELTHLSVGTSSLITVKERERKK